MRLRSYEEALELTNVLLKYNEESEVVNILVDLNIYIDIDYLDEVKTDYDTNVLKVFFIKYLEWNMDDIIDIIDTCSFWPKLADENDLENAIQENNRQLFDYFADKIKVMCATVEDAVQCRRKNYISRLSDIDSNDEVILIENVYVADDLISKSLAKKIAEKYLDDRYDYIELTGALLNNEYIDEYIRESIFVDGISSIKPYISKLIEQIKGHEQELINTCGITIEEFKNLNSINHDLIEFLLDYTDIVDLLRDDILS